MRYSSVYRSSFFLAGFLFLGACAHTNIIPQANGDYVMVATASSDNIAVDAALEKSNAHCNALGKHFAMVHQETKYQGMDKTAAAVIDVVGVLASPRNKYGSPYGYPGAFTRSNNDYKVEMTFRCL